MTSTDEAAAVDARVEPLARQARFRGFGMSLAWEANTLAGHTPKTRADFMDALYGDPDRGPTLGLNVVRYNIGGGENPSHHHMAKRALMDGFLDGSGATYQFDRDPVQRWMIHAAKDRGADLFEAFSNSPPYWMTQSQCASGNTDGSDNIADDHLDEFARYLVEVARHFRDAEGIEFESLEPMNEPDGTWWVADKHGSQEGCAFQPDRRAKMVRKLSRHLGQTDLRTRVVGGDTFHIAELPVTLDALAADGTALAAIERINTHSYSGSDADRATARQRAEALGKAVWMSEFGCCFGGTPGADDPFVGALTVADQIRADLSVLGAEAWVFWQPDWNIMKLDPDGTITRLPQYYAIAHYSSFIRPGFSIVESGVPGALAAYDEKTETLVLVATHTDPNGDPRTFHFDLTRFGRLPPAAEVFQTTDTATLARLPDAAISHKRLAVDAPDRSITTAIVRGASIEVNNEIVSLDTGHRCADLTGEGTTEGTPLELWDCTGGPNQRFHFRADTQEIRAYDDTMCLDASGARGQNGDRVILYRCNGGLNQKWRYDAARRAVVGIRGKCLDASGQKSGNGTALQIWDCWGGRNQQFALRPI